MPYCLCHKQIMWEQKHTKHKSRKLKKKNDAQTKLTPEVFAFTLPSEGQGMEHGWKNPGSFRSPSQDKIHWYLCPDNTGMSQWFLAHWGHGNTYSVKVKAWMLVFLKWFDMLGTLQKRSPSNKQEAMTDEMPTYWNLISAHGRSNVTCPCWLSGFDNGVWGWAPYQQHRASAAIRSALREKSRSGIHPYVFGCDASKTLLCDLPFKTKRTELTEKRCWIT